MLCFFFSKKVVCSTAGLCNNVAIDKLLEEYELQKHSFNCDKCNSVGNAISTKFHTSSRDQVLDGFLSACGHLSSFSDACSSIVLTFFDNIYDELSKNLKADTICHMSGACASKYHNHDSSSHIQIKTESNVGFINKDDIPCELCEQLVKHLRDVLIANTTEQEFKTVLLGLCSQTKGFKQECNSIINQYYGIIYETLVKNLDANGVCFLIGLCDKGVKVNAPHMPLLPSHQQISRKRLGQNEKVFSNEQIKSFILPIDKLMGTKSSLDLVDGGEKCAICTYFLHFVQEELSDAKNEDQIKEVVKKTCSKLPKSIQPSCDNFVDLYGDAIIALLVQEIDPRDVCPQLKLCPNSVNQDDVDIFSPNTIHVEINQENKPSCPLCELVVAQARQFIDSPKSKESAKAALSKVCKHLPPKPQLECNDFIETYYDELIDKLLSDLTPKGICSLLKLCPGKTENTEDTVKVGVEKLNFIPHIIVTNEIPDNTIDGQIIDTDSGECLLCTSVVGGAESKISHGMTKQQIEDVLLLECSKFHPYQGICDNFVEKNVDEIVDLLSKRMTPKEICHKLSLCSIEDDLNIDEAVIINVVAIPAVGRVSLTKVDDDSKKIIKDDPMCVLCEFVMAKLEQELKDKHTQEEIKQAVENICSKMPKSITKQCTKFVDQYAELIMTLIDTVPPKEICIEMSLCTPAKKKMHLVGDSECTWGPTHFCGDLKVAEKCKVSTYSLILYPN